MIASVIKASLLIMEVDVKSIVFDLQFQTVKTICYFKHVLCVFFLNLSHAVRRRIPKALALPFVGSYRCVLWLRDIMYADCQIQPPPQKT